MAKLPSQKGKQERAFSQEHTCAHKQKNNKGFLSHPFFCFVLFQALLRLTIASRDGEGKGLSKGKAKGSKQRPQGAKKDQRGSRCREQRSCSKHQGCLPLPFHLVLLSQVTLSHKYLLLLSFLKPPASLLTVLCFFANLGAVAQYDVYDEDNNIDFSKIRPVDGDESDAEYAVNSDDDEEIDSDAVRFFFSISFLLFFSCSQYRAYQQVLKSTDPDYQYTPKLIPSMVYIIGNNIYPVVFGSRILGKGALKGGMPMYKYIANRILTLIQNLLIKLDKNVYRIVILTL